MIRIFHWQFWETRSAQASIAPLNSRMASGVITGWQGNDPEPRTLRSLKNPL